MSELKQVHCPSCQATLRFKRTASSVVALTCPTCAHAFEVRLPTANPTGNPSTSVVDALPTSSPTTADAIDRPVIAKPVIAKPVLAKPVAPGTQTVDNEAISPAESSITEVDLGAFAEAPSPDVMRPVLIPKRKASNLQTEHPWLLPVAIGGGVACLCLVVGLFVIVSSGVGQNLLASLNTESQEGSTREQNAPTVVRPQTNIPTGSDPVPFERHSAATRSSTTANPRVSKVSETQVFRASRDTDDADEGSSDRDEEYRPLLGPEARTTVGGININNPNLDAVERSQARVRAFVERATRDSRQLFPEPLLTGPDSLTIRISGAKRLNGNMLKVQMRAKLATPIAGAVPYGDDLMLNFRYSGSLADAAKMIDFGTIELSDSQSRTIYVDASQN